MEFARMLSEQTGCEVKGFQSFVERQEEKRTMEAILAEHGTPLEMGPFLSGEKKPVGLVIVYLNPEQEDATLYEMSAEVSDNWRRRV